MRNVASRINQYSKNIISMFNRYNISSIADRINIEYDNAFFCFAIVFHSAVTLFVNTVRMFVSGTHSLDTLFVYGLMAIVFLKALPVVLKTINVRDLIFFFFLALSFCISLLNPISDTETVKTVLVEILTDGLLVYLGAKCVHDSPKLALYLRISATIVVLRVLGNEYVFPSGEDVQSYSQFEGYLLLTAMALLFIPLIKEKKLFDIILTIVIFISTLLTGARGPFLFSGMLIVIGLFITNTTRTKKTIVRYILPVGIIMIVYHYMEKILLFISLHAGNAASLRTINRLLNNEFFQDSSRGKIINVALDYIDDHMFYGCGLLNDRVIINNAISGKAGIIGSYPHNLFLELGMQYGIIIGLCISIIILVVIIRRYLKCSLLQEKLMLIALIGAGFAPLMVSASYLSFTMFYALMGFCNSESRVFGGKYSRW